MVLSEGDCVSLKYDLKNVMVISNPKVALCPSLEDKEGSSMYPNFFLKVMLDTSDNVY